MLFRSKNRYDLRAVSWGKFLWKELICVKNLTFRISVPTFPKQENINMTYSCVGRQYIDIIDTLHIEHTDDTFQTLHTELSCCSALVLLALYCSSALVLLFS